MKNAEIREIPTKELQERLETEVAADRRNIARIKTELRQRELNK